MRGDERKGNKEERKKKEMLITVRKRSNRIKVKEGGRKMRGKERR